MQVIFSYNGENILFSLSYEQFKALQNLKQDKSIIVSRLDKDNGVVVMNKSSCLSKMYDILSDNTKFQSCKLDNNISYLAKFQRFLRSLKAKGILDNDDYKQLYPSSASTPAMYGLPKVHKLAVPLRPILSAIGSFNHEAAKWLTGKLSFLRDHPTNIKESFKFIDNIKDECFQNKIMVSFDVKSLFTNIPVSFTIKRIIDVLYHNDRSSNSNTLFNGFNPTKMKQFLEWVTKSGTFLFNNEYFEQKDGVPMGGKASNLFADVILSYNIDKAMEITPLQYKPFVFYRYVDDCFSVCNDKKSVIEFEKILYSIQYTLTLLSQQNYNPRIA